MNVDSRPWKPGHCFAQIKKHLCRAVRMQQRGAAHRYQVASAEHTSSRGYRDARAA
jgi:hypothetical protein